MTPTRTITAALVVLAMLSGSAAADELKLTGTLRDFREAHPDFENTYNGQYPLIQGMVKDRLGADGTPVLDPPEGSITKGDDRGSDARMTVLFREREVEVSSTKDLSNVVIKLSGDGTEHKFDGLSVGQSHTFAVPDQYDSGQTIVGVWVKSGSYQSGDGPGYGRWFGADEATSDIPEQWRIESEMTFEQWHSNVEGVNRSKRHTIVLDNGRQQPGGVYRFEKSKHNNESFFPINDELYGNTDGYDKNYHFTYEVHTRFTYTDPATRDEPMVFSFSGDDDVWVYINDRLVVDLGGVHPEKYGHVNVDEKADELGLEPGKDYDFDFFFAERHTVESNFTIETTIQFFSPLYD